MSKPSGMRTGPSPDPADWYEVATSAKRVTVTRADPTGVSLRELVGGPQPAGPRLRLGFGGESTSPAGLSTAGMLLWSFLVNAELQRQGNPDGLGRSSGGDSQVGGSVWAFEREVVQALCGTARCGYWAPPYGHLERSLQWIDYCVQGGTVRGGRFQHHRFARLEAGAR
jgi:hypothetical protein